MSTYILVLIMKNLLYQFFSNKNMWNAKPVKMFNEKYLLHRNLVSNGTKEQLIELLKQRDINEVDDDKQTILHLATFLNLYSKLKLILSFKANLQAEDNQGNTALHYAVRSSETKSLKFLIENGANVNVPNKRGETPLHLALECQQGKAVEILLKTGKCKTTIQDEDNRQPLDIAITNKDAKCVKLLLNHGVDCNKKIISGRPIQAAVVSRDLKLVKTLLTFKPRLNDFDLEGNTPLHLAVAHRLFAVASLLLKINANALSPFDINAVNLDGKTPLHLAASGGRSQMVELLVKHGANCHSQDNLGNSPLHDFCRRKSEKTSIAMILLGHGAKADQHNSFGETPVSIASHLQKVELVELLKKSCRVDHSSHSDIEIAIKHKDAAALERMVKNNADLLELENGDGHRPLHLACSSRNPKLVQILLESGANFNAVDQDGMTPIFHAIANHDVQVVKLLLEWRSEKQFPVYKNRGLLLHHAIENDILTDLFIENCNYSINTTNGDGKTPLHVATELCKTSYARMLISSGADINPTDQSGRTPLDIAILNGHSPLIELLLSKDALRCNKYPRAPEEELEEDEPRINEEMVSLEIQSISRGDFPLHFAIDKRSFECARLLIQHGADVNVANQIGESPLHRAVLTGKMDWLYMLMEVGVKLNTHNAKGQTPFHFACMKKFVTMVEFLAKNYDVNEADIEGNTALHYASKIGSAKLTFVLLTHEAKTEIENHKHEYPLQISYKSHHEKVVKLLISFGASDKTIWHLL